jgi:hypothetical protein
MDIGIIAASLVVMRPCLQAMYDLARGRRISRSLDGSTKRGDYNTSKTQSRLGGSDGRGGKAGLGLGDKITRTVDIEMRSVSTEDMLDRGDQEGHPRRG